MSNAEITKTTGKTVNGKPTAAIALYNTEKDIYTVEEVSKILHLSRQATFDLIWLEKDPLPARKLKYKGRGYLIMRHDLNEWVKRNAPYLNAAVLENYEM